MTRRLLFLNGLAVLGVIINHTVGWGYVAMFWWTDQYRAVTVPNFDQLGSASYFGLRLSEQLITYSIAAFLLVSGYFAAFGAGKARTVSWGFVRGRIQYLVIPYLFWTAVMLASDLLLKVPHTLADLPRIILLGKITPAFYFVPLLVQCYLLAPFLVPLARSRPVWLLAAAGALQLAVGLILYALALQVPLPGGALLAWLTPGWFFPGHVFWFVLGIVLGFHYQSVRPRLVRWRWALLAGLVALVPLAMAEWEALQAASGDWLSPRHTALDMVYAGMFLLTLLAFERARYPATRPLTELGSRSYGVYLAHSVVLTYTAKLVYHLAPWLLGYQWLLQPVLFAAGLGLPLLLMYLVSRSPARRIYVYQFG